MEKVQHLWNVVNQLSSNQGADAIGLQSFYVERCRRMESEVELPKSIFGSGAMCSYCGSLWSEVDHRVRFVSGKKPAKSVGRILKMEKKVGRVKETLAKKAVRNSGNKAMIRCCFCSKLTTINMAKPERRKPAVNEKVKSTESQTPVVKKRKKRTKDKTAGLIITPDSNKKPQNLTPQIKSPKAKPTNLNKLGAMVNKNLTPAKKSSLHDFIMELGS